MLIASKATIIFDIDFCAFDEGIGLADGICSTLSLVNLIEGLNDEEGFELLGAKGSPIVEHSK